VTLLAEGIKFKPEVAEKDRNATFTINVDGYDRLAAYTTNFKDTQPAPLKTYLNPRLSEDAVLTGKAVRVLAETYAIEGNKTLSLSVGRPDKDDASFDKLLEDKPLRQKEIFVKPGTENDALVFTTVLKDWDLTFPTNGVAGKRIFRMKVKDTGSPKDNVLVVDRTPPEVKYTSIIRTADLEVGKKPLVLTATASDDESDIAKVLFFVGDVPGADLKPAAGGKVITGKPVKGKDGKISYTAELLLPLKPGEIKIGVLAVNRVGLVANSPDEPVEYFVRDKAAPKPKPTTGSVKGKVVSGSTAQPGLEVVLLDSTGKTTVKSTTTDKEGAYKIEGIEPGSYILRSTKKGGWIAVGEQKVSVVADEEAQKVKDINVLR
jgi:hypothetical protein